eukprot:5324505-Pyramimonas_sp.AAC.1
MELEVTGLRQGLIRKLEEEAQGGPEVTRRRIEAAIQRAVEQNERMDLGHRATGAGNQTGL